MRSDILEGDCVQSLLGLPAGHASSIVTDPPYGLSPDGKARTWDEIEEGKARGGFMGRDWDAAVPGITWAKACLHALKPGGWIAAFSSTRTQHRLTCALEDAGFEIRDVICVAQFQGFPKSQSASLALDRHLGAEREVIRTEERWNEPSGIVGAGRGAEARTWIERKITAAASPEAKMWDGWGTALKPAYEPCILARKPMIGTLAQNLLEHGAGALNIDACRFAPGDPAWLGPSESMNAMPYPKGNRILGRLDYKAHEIWEPSEGGRWPANVYHSPKPARTEREAGCEALPTQTSAEMTNRKEGSAGLANGRCGRSASGVANIHPTVKPVQAMRWLVRLLTPPDGICIDPFLGSGTTGIAAALEQRHFIGMEREPDYIRIARSRIDHWGRQQQFNFEEASP